MVSLGIVICLLRFAILAPPAENYISSVTSDLALHNPRIANFLVFSFRRGFGFESTMYVERLAAFGHRTNS